MIAVADAIAYAQGKGIIHRDLTPGNVNVGDFGETTFSGAFSPDGTLFASSDLQGTVTVRDVAATFATARQS